MTQKLEKYQRPIRFYAVGVLNSLGVYLKVPYRTAVTIRNSVPTTNSTRVYPKSINALITHFLMGKKKKKAGVQPANLRWPIVILN